jgi:hypothetical protein
MKKKATYRIRNWKEYNQALTQRGSLTVWISEEALKNWTTKEKNGQPGASPTYTDRAIETLVLVMAIYCLPGRQATGFVGSLFKLMKISLPIPDHTTISRRRGKLSVALPVKQANGPRHLVIDSTGVKVYGEGEWKVRQHGWSQRRTWRKLHLCIDEATGEIVSACASTNDIIDAQMLPELLDGVNGPIAQVSADGAYDRRNCYEALDQRQARAAIPPRKGARIWQHGNSKAERQARDENLRRIRRVGKKTWKKEVGYHRRSLAETAVFRYKTAFGDRLQSRKVENQFNEIFIKCTALNRMFHLGKPQSYKVEI